MRSGNFLIVLALMGFPASEAVAGIYRCTDTNGRTIYTDEPCENGVDTGIEAQGYDTMSPYEAAQTIRIRSQSMRRQAEALSGDKGDGGHRPKRPSSQPISSYASARNLARLCGQLFDGVNANYLPGLERSRKLRLESLEANTLNRKEARLARKELRELNCRIKRLRMERSK